MKNLGQLFRDIFFFLVGVATGISGLVLAVYIWLLQQEAKSPRRPDYTTYRGRGPRVDPEEKPAEA